MTMELHMRRKPVMGRDRVQCNLKMDRRLHQRLKTIAIERDMTMQAILEQAVRQHLDSIR